MKKCDSCGKKTNRKPTMYGDVLCSNCSGFNKKNQNKIKYKF